MLRRWEGSRCSFQPGLWLRLSHQDFTHIGLAASLPMIVVVHVAVPVKSVKELIELAKAKPNTLNFASSSSGSLPHLVGELFKSRTGAPITHVPYKGSGPAVVDLAAGNVQVMFDAVPSLVGQIKTGRLRVIGSVAAKRSELFPDAPTIHPGRAGEVGASRQSHGRKGGLETLSLSCQLVD